MNYKAVIEEQIRELQKVQDKAIHNPEMTCKIAETIASLCQQAVSFPDK